MPEPEDPGPRAAIVAVQLPDVDDDAFAASVTELERLARTLGLDVAATVTQRRSALHAATVVGSGKLGELLAWTGTGAADGAETDGAETDGAERDGDGDQGKDREGGAEG